MLVGGGGGNVTVQIGNDGVLLVDTGLAAPRPSSWRRSASFPPAPFATSINTHAHAGSYRRQRGSGQARRDARPRLRRSRHCAHQRPRTAWSRRLPATRRCRGPALAQRYLQHPLQGFLLQRRSRLRYHIPHAHTDGDSIVFFRRSDVLSVGDLFTPGPLPLHRSRPRRQRARASSTG